MQHDWSCAYNSRKHTVSHVMIHIYQNYCSPFTNSVRLQKGVLCDAVHRYYQGVLYFHYVVEFHHTCINVISRMPVQIALPSMFIFAKLRNDEHHYVHISVPNFIQMYKVRRGIHLCPQMEYGFHRANIHQPQNCSMPLNWNGTQNCSMPLNGNGTQNCSVPLNGNGTQNSNHASHEIQKVWVETDLCP
jgi:hypothetical protein